MAAMNPSPVITTRQIWRISIDRNGDGRPLRTITQPDVQEMVEHEIQGIHINKDPASRML